MDGKLQRHVTNRWSQPLPAVMITAQHVYEIRPRKDHRGVNLISDELPFGRLWYGEPDATNNAIDYAKFYSRSHHAVIRVYDAAGNLIETHEHAGASSKSDCRRGPYRIAKLYSPANGSLLLRASRAALLSQRIARRLRLTITKRAVRGRAQFDWFRAPLQNEIKL
jgi:hypothetical protein